MLWMEQHSGRLALRCCAVRNVLKRFSANCCLRTPIAQSDAPGLDILILCGELSAVTVSRL